MTQDQTSSLGRLLASIKAVSPAKKAGLLGLLITAVAALLYLIFSLSFLGKVYPRVYVGGESYAGLTQEQVKDRLAKVSQASLSQPTQLVYKDKTNTIAAKDANWSLDADKTAQAVYGIGRSGNRWQSFLRQLGTPFTPHNIDPAVSYDTNFLQSTVAAVADSVDQPATNATAEFQNDQLVITKEKNGEKINQDKAIAEVLKRWSTGSADPVTLISAPDYPTIILNDESALRSNVDKLSQAKLTLKWGDTQKALTTKEIHQLIGFVGGEDLPAQIVPTKVLSAAFTSDKVKSYLQDLATNSINQPATDPKLGIQDGKLIVLASSAKGRVVDVDASADRVLSAINGSSTDPVDLLFKDVSPVITEDSLDSLGIKERIGFGQTSFAGSPANRKANIANGVKLLQSALIKPGDEFSTVQTLGAVDGSTGFLPELVIKDNKTTPEFGGGLCQVSTTLFRAVMNAGLKVTERQNHSYRVGYYEPPVGLDATIYLPKPDFKFLNDTGHYILLQGRLEGNNVIFELWGTSDGRSSQISDPQILSTTPAGNPIYNPTDTLFKGQTKQTEHPHDGAVTIAYYTVMRNGQVINKQTFKSIYKPWPAQFLVGTKDPGDGSIPPVPTQ